MANKHRTAVDVDGNHLTEASLHEWVDAVFDLSVAAKWVRHGFTPEEARRWAGNGFKPKQARAWANAGFVDGDRYPSTITYYLPRPQEEDPDSFDYNEEVEYDPIVYCEAAVWMFFGFSPKEAARWRIHFDPEEAAAWRKLYKNPNEACLWATDTHVPEAIRFARDTKAAILKKLNEQAARRSRSNDDLDF